MNDTPFYLALLYDNGGYADVIGETWPNYESACDEAASRLAADESLEVVRVFQRGTGPGVYHRREEPGLNAEGDAR